MSLSLKYAPFNKNGGGNQGCLYQISQEFANFLLELVGHSRLDEEDIIKKIEDELPPELGPAEKELIVKTRIGQGIFKSKLLQFGCKCKICSISNLTPQSGKIFVQCYKEGNRMVFTVKVTGKGFSSEEIHRVFEPITI